MKDLWKYFAKMAIPMIEAAGEAKKAEDENTTGRDDLIGSGLVYAAQILQAIISGKEIPKAPAVLT